MTKKPETFPPEQELSAILDKVATLSQDIINASFMKDTDQIGSLLEARSHLLDKANAFEFDSLSKEAKNHLREKMRLINNLQPEMEKCLNDCKGALEQQMKALKSSKSVLSGYRLNFSNDSTLSSEA